MGTITDIQRFSIHDGPGVRTTVFLKGCPLRCRWCHNPETNEPGAQIRLVKHRCAGCGACEAVCPVGGHKITQAGHTFSSYDCVFCKKCVEACPMMALSVCGNEKSAEEIVEEALRDVPFYGQDGGITVSGGEPLMQGDFCTEILMFAKEKGLGTAIQTCGQFQPKYVSTVVNLCDHVMWDVKFRDTEKHREYTGVGNELILKNLAAAAKERKDILVRTVIVAGVSDTAEHVHGVADVAMELGLTQCPKLLAFHPFGSSKGDEVGLDKRVKMGEEYIPTPEKMEELNAEIAAYWDQNRKEN